MSSRFASLEEIISDPAFPEIDVALRRGRHIDRDDGDWYTLVSDAQDHLEPFYRRYGCELVARSDGYFHLLPTGDQLSRRHLTAGEMLLGQTLALQYLDPSTVQSGGVMTREQALARLAGLVDDRQLAKALEPRRRRFDDERVVHEIIRRGVGVAIRRLASLGFIEILDDAHIRLRAPLLRFADPVRGLADASEAMERLIARGEIVDLSANGDGSDDDGRDDDGSDDDGNGADVDEDDGEAGDATGADEYDTSGNEELEP
jgi:chromosome partition protein MukE